MAEDRGEESQTAEQPGDTSATLKESPRPQPACRGALGGRSSGSSTCPVLPQPPQQPQASQWAPPGERGLLLGALAHSLHGL